MPSIGQLMKFIIGHIIYESNVFYCLECNNKTLTGTVPRIENWSEINHTIVTNNNLFESNDIGSFLY